MMEEEEAHAAPLSVEGHDVPVSPTDTRVSVLVFWDVQTRQLFRGSGNMFIKPPAGGKVVQEGGAT